MMPIPSATQWGSPTASKRALLLHGNTCSSHTWERVGQSLAKADFLVTAPNMLGHGNRPADDLRLDAYVQDIYSTYFANRSTFDVIIGHSFGGTIVLALLPLLSVPHATGTKKMPVILVDPGIVFSDRVLDEFASKYGNEIHYVRNVEAVMAEFPRWTREDAVSRVIGLYTAQSELPRRIFEQVKPYQYRHLFDAMPPHVEMTVLIADPGLSEVCPPELVPAHPQIRRVITVKESSHWIQHENPDVIVETAVDEVDRLCSLVV